MTPTLWVDPTGPDAWRWGRGDELVGHLARNHHGGIESVDVDRDLDLVTALCMARIGQTTWTRGFDSAHELPPAPPRRPAGEYRRRQGPDGPTLAERAALGR